MSNLLLELQIPMRIQSAPNLRAMTRGAVFARNKQKREDKNAVRLHLIAAYGKAPPTPPLIVTLCRIAPHMLDDDNAVGAVKHHRDSVAEWLGINDRHADLVKYVVEQRRGKVREYALEIRIESSIREVIDGQPSVTKGYR